MSKHQPYTCCAADIGSTCPSSEDEEIIQPSLYNLQVTTIPSHIQTYINIHIHPTTHTHRVNGVPITHTPPLPLSFPSLSVDFRQSFEFRFLHLPSSLSLEIKQTSSGGSLGTFGSSIAQGLGLGGGGGGSAVVYVALPGVAGAGAGSGASAAQGEGRAAAGVLAPSVAWLSFSSATAAGAAAGGMGGRVLCGSEWDASSEGGGGGRFVVLFVCVEEGVCGGGCVCEFLPQFPPPSPCPQN